MSAVTFGARPSVPKAKCKVMHRHGDERFVPNGDFEYDKFFKGLTIDAESRHHKRGPLVTHNNGAVYQCTELIGSGAAGDVFKFVLVDSLTKPEVRSAVPYCFALKGMESSEEEDVIKLLEKKNIKIQFSTISTRGFESTTCFVAMPLFDGTLYDYMKSLGRGVSLSVAINIMITSLNLVSKLWAAGLSYMDFKTTNVLYVACGEGSCVPVSLVLGDIGSIHELSSHKLATSTYPHPVGFNPIGGSKVTRVPQTMEGMMWSIAISCIQLVGFGPGTCLGHDDIVHKMADARSNGMCVEDINKNIYKSSVDIVTAWVDSLGDALDARVCFKDAIVTLTGKGDGTYAIPVVADPACAVDDIIAHLKTCEQAIDDMA